MKHMDIKKKLKELEKEEARIARQKKALLEAEAKKAQTVKKLEALVKQSGFASAKELVVALVEQYGLRVPAGKRASGGKARRKRTVITAALRDELKKAVKAGESMNSVSKRTGISYLVVAKICKGHYDNLKD